MQTTVQVETHEPVVLRDVTETVGAALPDQVSSGVCHVFVSHTTAGLLVNEAESNLLEDVLDRVEALVPEGAGYAHDQLDDNADAHLRALLLGNEVTVPVSQGELALGTWQRLLLCEGDGPRTRSLQVTVIED